MTSFIAACGSGRSTSFIPAVPAAWSVTTIAFMGIVSSVICIFGGNVASMGACRSRTNADDRLPLASLGRVESGDGSFNAAETMFASPAVADHRCAHVPHNHSVTRGEILLLTGLRSPLLRFTWSDQKCSDRRCDFVAVRLQRKVAGIKEAHISVRHVAFECLRTSRQEKGIVLAPHRQKWRLVFAEIALEFGI